MLAASLALLPLSGCGQEEHPSAPDEHPVDGREVPLYLDPAVAHSGAALPPPLLVPAWCFAASLTRSYEYAGRSESLLPFAESAPMDVDCRPPFPVLPPHGGGVVGRGDEALRQLLLVSSAKWLPTGLLEPDEEAREFGVTSRGGYWRLAVRTVRRGFPPGPADEAPMELGRGGAIGEFRFAGVGLHRPVGFATVLAPGWYAHCVPVPWYDERLRVGAECVAGHCWGRIHAPNLHAHLLPDPAEEANDPAERPEPTPYLWVGLGPEHLCLATTTFGDDADFEDLVQGMREQWVEERPAPAG